MQDSPTLAQLLVFPVVMEMFSDLTEANRRVARALDSHAALQQEVLRLSAEVREMSAGRYADST